MKAIILAAGLGTRLRPLTERIAKPALTVCGVPGLWYNIFHIYNSLKINQFAINVSHLPDTVVHAAEDKDLCRLINATFHFSDESAQILGSSGALWKLKEWIHNDVVIVSNGDSICNLDWQAMLNQHIKNNAVMTMHLRPFESSLDEEKYTTFNVSKNYQIESLNNKLNKGIMFSGNYIIDSKAVKLLPEGVSELVPSIVNPLIKEKKCYAFVQDTEWYDLGNIKSFYEAQLKIVENPSVYKKLIETKMDFKNQNSVISKNINSNKIKITGPCIIDCTQNELERIKKSVGPNSVIIHPVNEVSEIKNALSFQDIFHQF